MRTNTTHNTAPVSARNYIWLAGYTPPTWFDKLARSRTRLFWRQAILVGHNKCLLMVTRSSIFFEGVVLRAVAYRGVFEMLEQTEITPRLNQR